MEELSSLSMDVGSLASQFLLTIDDKSFPCGIQWRDLASRNGLETGEINGRACVGRIAVFFGSCFADSGVVWTGPSEQAAVQ